MDVHHSDDYAFYVGVNDSTFDRLYVHDNPGYGIHLYQSGHDDHSNNVIRNSVFVNNAKESVYCNGWVGQTNAILVSSGSNNVVYNTVSYDNGGGIAVYGNCVDCAVYNNTVYNNINSGVDLAGPNAIVRNNILFANGASITDYGAPDSAVDHNLTDDPGFVDVGGADFRLQATSPAIDAGTSVGGVDVDIQGTARPQGASYDIGAHEYSDGTTSSGSGAGGGTSTGASGAGGSGACEGGAGG